MGTKIPLICITGTSAAGKTHFSEGLARALREKGYVPVVLASDDYYRQGWNPDPIYGFDTIDAIDAEALLRELEQLQQGNLRQRRRYDMTSKDVSWSALTPGWDVAILEGAFGPQLLLGQMSPDLLVYVETPLVLRILRRLRRDTRERGRSLRSVLHQTFSHMIAGEQRFITPLKERADAVIHNPQKDLKRIVQFVRKI